MRRKMCPLFTNIVARLSCVVDQILYDDYHALFFSLPLSLVQSVATSLPFNYSVFNLLSIIITFFYGSSSLSGVFHSVDELDSVERFRAQKRDTV